MRGVAALPSVTQIVILAKVREFDAFTLDNDPHGEHDFGSFDEPGVGKIFWSIDLYDRDCRYGRPDPTVAKITRRGLIIMLTEEYGPLNKLIEDRCCTASVFIILIRRSFGTVLECPRDNAVIP